MNRDMLCVGIITFICVLIYNSIIIVKVEDKL